MESAPNCRGKLGEESVVTGHFISQVCVNAGLWPTNENGGAGEHGQSYGHTAPYDTFERAKLGTRLMSLGAELQWTQS